MRATLNTDYYSTTIVCDKLIASRRVINAQVTILSYKNHNLKINARIVR
jgi:hypothetical protein